METRFLQINSILSFRLRFWNFRKYDCCLLNFISFSDRIIQKGIPLYEKGLSFTQFSDIIGVATSSIFDLMKDQKRAIRSAKAARKTNPSLGYAWLSGKLVLNPAEYETVELIRNLHQSGMRPYHIEKHLNQRGIPTRNGSKWFARIVTNILAKEMA